MYGDTPLKGNVPVTSTLIERDYCTASIRATRASDFACSSSQVRFSLNNTAICYFIGERSEHQCARRVLFLTLWGGLGFAYNPPFDHRYHMSVAINDLHPIQACFGGQVLYPGLRP